MAVAVTLRPMRAEEYVEYTMLREDDTVNSLQAILPTEAARRMAQEGTKRFLPDGLATEGHRLLVAVDNADQILGHAWLGLAEPRTGVRETAWLYDIRVFPEHHRQGVARAMLEALEKIARDAGARRLGLNVFGANHAAIKLYASTGYAVSTQEMAKELATP
jgi:GNAT superfamily N-acetyltransferase